MTLRCLGNYARSRTAVQCRDVLQKHVVRGFDDGLILAPVRHSYGLTPDETAAADPVHETLEFLANREPPVETGARNPDISRTQAMIAAHRAEQKQAVQQIRQWLCDERKDWFTLAQVTNAKSNFVFNFNKHEAQNVIEKMVDDGKMVSAPALLTKVGQTTIFLPIYSYENAIGDVVPMKQDHQKLVFTEKYSVYHVCSRLAPTTFSRSLNLKTLAQLYRRRLQGSSKKKSAPKRSRNADVDDVKVPQALEDVMDQGRSRMKG